MSIFLSCFCKEKWCYWNDKFFSTFNEIQVENYKSYQIGKFLMHQISRPWQYKGHPLPIKPGRRSRKNSHTILSRVYFVDQSYYAPAPHLSQNIKRKSCHQLHHSHESWHMKASISKCSMIPVFSPIHNRLITSYCYQRLYALAMIHYISLFPLSVCPIRSHYNFKKFVNVSRKFKQSTAEKSLHNCKAVINMKTHTYQATHLSSNISKTIKTF